MSKIYGVIYGADWRGDYHIDGPYTSIDEARAAYHPDKRTRYMDGVVGGAAIVEVFELHKGGLYHDSVNMLDIGETVEELCADDWSNVK